jgi:hypothetical protein
MSTTKQTDRNTVITLVTSIGKALPKTDSRLEGLRKIYSRLVGGSDVRGQLLALQGMFQKGTKGCNDCQKLLDQLPQEEPESNELDATEEVSVISQPAPAATVNQTEVPVQESVMESTPVPAPTPEPTPVQELVDVAALTEQAGVRSIQVIASRLPLGTLPRDVAEARIRAAQRLLKASDVPLWRLQYDIPTAARTENGYSVQNPSGELWGIACREQYSIWVVREPEAKSIRFRRVLSRLLRAKNASPHHRWGISLLRVHPQDQEVIRRRARAELADAIVELRLSIFKRVQDAAARLVEIEKELHENGEATDKALAAARAANDNNERGILRAAQENYKAFLETARVFDDTESVDELLGMLRQAIQAQATDFNARMAAKGSKQVEVTI